MRKMGISVLFLVGSLAATPFLTGCDSAPGDKVVNKSETKTTDPNGRTNTSEQKTVQHSDGTVSTEKHVETNK